LPGLVITLVYSLLLEDFSSVELKDTPDSLECKRGAGLYFCGNAGIFVEMFGLAIVRIVFRVRVEGFGSALRAKCSIMR
jgi:hypothetical protein